MRVVKSEVTASALEAEARLAQWKLLGSPESVVMLDIETTGFSRLYDSIYLIGALVYESGRWFVYQYLAGNRYEEPEMLVEALCFLRRYDIWVTYNGDMFDLPFIEERAKRLRVYTQEDTEAKARRKSLDLFRMYRPYRRFFHWPNMKLKTIEAEIGLNRQDPFSGGELIEVYNEYARTDDSRLEHVLLLHNYEDIADLLPLLRIEAFFHEIKEASPERVELKGQSLLIDWDRPFSLSHQLEAPLVAAKKKDTAEQAAVRYTWEAGSCRCQIDLPEPSDAVYYYLPNPGDYYFLPETGEIVHRSLYFDGGQAPKRKAKPAECALLGQGEFLQIFPAPAGLRTYRCSYQERRTYAKTDELAAWLQSTEEDIVKTWMKDWMKALLW